MGMLRFMHLCLLAGIAFTSCAKDFRFLSDGDILSASYPVSVNERVVSSEPGQRYPLFADRYYFKKGVNIPLREELRLRPDTLYKYAVFFVGADRFNFPDAEMRCRLEVYGDGELLYESEDISYGSGLEKVSVCVEGIDTLKFHVQEISRKLYDSPDNWADVYNFSVDLVDFVWSDSEQIEIQEGFLTEAENDETGIDIEKIGLPSSAWTVAYVKDADIILAGCFDNSVYALDMDGNILWRTELEGLPHKISYTYDDGLRICVFNWSDKTNLTFMDCDGTVTASVDNDCKIDALTSHGKRFYAVDSESILKEYSSSGDLLSENKLRGAKRNAVSLEFMDNTASGDTCLLMGTINNLYCYGSGYTLEWQKTINPFNPFLSATHELEYFPFSDGSMCTAVGCRPGSIAVLNEKGDVIWRDRYVGRGHSAPEIAVGNFIGDERMEIAGVSPDGIFHIYGDTGERIWRWEKQRMPFVDLATVQNRSGKDYIVAASAGPRDRSIYILKFNSSRRDSGLDPIGNFREDHVTPTMLEIGKQAMECPFYKENARDINVSFLFDPFGGNYTNPEAFYNRDILPEAVQRCRRIKEITDSLSGNNVHFIPMLDIWSCVFHKERRDILDYDLNLSLLAELEKMDLDFAIFVMHGNYIPLEYIRKIVRQNPGTLKAFHFSERKGMEDYKLEVMKIAKENGIKVLFGIHQDHWLNVTQNRQEFQALFSPEFKDVIVPVVKPNPSSFDLNLMSVLGLWSEGYMSEWGVASQHWNWNWITRNIDDMFPLDLLFRHDFQAASLGATWYLPEGDFEQSLELLPSWHTAREPFYNLLKSGIFAAESPKENARFSPLMIKYNKDDSYNFLKDNRPGDFFTTGLYEGLLMSVPEDCFSKDITGSDRYLDNCMLKMPLGFVRIVPERRDLAHVEGWSTDGQSLYHDGIVQNGTDGLVAALESETYVYPADTKDAFLSIQEDGDRYILYISDADYFYPEQKTVRLRFSKSLDKDFKVYDYLSRRELVHDGYGLEFDLAPGGVKILFLYDCTPDR